MKPHGSVATLVVASLLVAVGPAGAEAPRWLEVRGPHFTVVSDAGGREARRITQQFETLRSLIMEVTDFRVDSKTPIVILALRDGTSMQRVLPRDWEGQDHTHPAGIFVKAEARHYIVVRADLTGPRDYHLALHEYVHSLTTFNYGALPLWLLEGLAEFYGAAELDGSSVRWGRIDARHLQALKSHRWVPVEALLTAVGDSPYYTRASWTPAFYAESALLTHYLLLGPPEARRSFNELRRALGTFGDDGAGAFPDPGALETALRRYAKGDTFSLYARPLASGGPGDVAERPLSEAAALAICGDVMVHTGGRVEGRSLLEKSLAEDTSDPLTWAALISVARVVGRHEEVQQLVDQALVRVPDDATVQYQAALALPRKGDAAWAALKEQRLRRAVGLDPDFVDGLRTLADFYVSQSVKLEEATRLARRACEIEPQSFWAHLTLAEALGKAGQTDAAALEERGLRRVAEADPSYLEPLARSLDRSGRPEDAEALLADARARRPKDLTTLRALGNWLSSRKRYDEAETAYREALAGNPETPDILNSLGYINADRGVKLAESLDLIDRALKRQPKNPAYLDSRGWALYRLGRLADAEAALRSALTSWEDAVILDHLADVVLARGARADAVTLWQRALGSDKAPDELANVIEKKLREVEADRRRSLETGNSKPGPELRR